ncbi:MAG: hypothetical protein PHD19_13200 [Dechloromonas sp.]|nr:hypothetical protein [Dechloromonas sp.]
MSGSPASLPQRIVSAVPGRIRVRDPALRNPRQLADLSAALDELDGILELAGNPRTGSLVVHFDHRRLAVEALEHLVDTALDRPAAPARPGGQSRRRQFNRYAKIGMLASLGASLAFLATGQKRAHAVAGALFVAGLGVHLTVHRQLLVR